MKNPTLRYLLLTIGMTLPTSLFANEMMKFLDFEGDALPKNRAGNLYPSQYTGEGGEAQVSLLGGEAPYFGKRVVFEMTRGMLLAEFNAHNADGSRGFAREYVKLPSAWKFNTFNRLSFWIKNPVNGSQLATNGTSSVEIGTYVKRVANADRFSDEAGGAHFYHFANLPNTGTWTRVIVNPHPNHERGANGNVEHGNQLHPTDEAGYNYFDALTRFYINETDRGAVGAPIRYELDNFEFYQEPNPENDDQVYTMVATHVPADGRVILTWNRRKDEDNVNHEVRYATRSIHEIGWAAATPAPSGIVTPRGDGGYNNMVYITTAIKVDGPLYLAVKPQNSQLFSQIILDSRPANTVGIAPPAHPIRSLRQWLAVAPSAEMTLLDGAGRSRFTGSLAEYLAGGRNGARIPVQGLGRVTRNGKLLWTGPIVSP